MTTIHVVKFGFLGEGIRAQRGLVTLGGRSVDLWLSSTSRYSRLLITTDTTEGLPQTRTDHENRVMIRRDAVNKSLHVIAINGPALGPALTHAWAPHLNVPELGAQLVKALEVALPEHQFV